MTTTEESSTELVRQLQSTDKFRRRLRIVAGILAIPGIALALAGVLITVVRLSVQIKLRGYPDAQSVVHSDHPWVYNDRLYMYTLLAVLVVIVLMIANAGVDSYRNRTYRKLETLHRATTDALAYNLFHAITDDPLAPRDQLCDEAEVAVRKLFLDNLLRHPVAAPEEPAKTTTIPAS